MGTCTSVLSLVDVSYTTAVMAYSHDNRIKYVVRYLYDIDNNGVLDKNDFKCLAVRNTIVETKGDFPAERFAQNAKIMDDLWNEIAQLADLTRMVKLMLMSSRRPSMITAPVRITHHSPQHSRSSLRTNSNQLTLMVMAQS